MLFFWRAIGLFSFSLLLLLVPQAVSAEDGDGQNSQQNFSQEVNLQTNGAGSVAVESSVKVDTEGGITESTEYTSNNSLPDNTQPADLNQQPEGSSEPALNVQDGEPAGQDDAARSGSDLEPQPQPTSVKEHEPAAAFVSVRPDSGAAADRQAVAAAARAIQPSPESMAAADTRLPEADGAFGNWDKAVMASLSSQFKLGSSAMVTAGAAIVTWLLAILLRSLPLLNNTFTAFLRRCGFWHGARSDMAVLLSSFATPEKTGFIRAFVPAYEPVFSWGDKQKSNVKITTF